MGQVSSIGLDLVALYAMGVFFNLAARSRPRHAVSCVNGGQKGVGAAIIAGVNAAPVLEPAEHILDFVALALKGLVVVDMDFAVGL